MKVDCDIIRDLIPSYLDKVSSEATNKLVEKHLETCKKLLRRITKYEQRCRCRRN